jgi:hypothetical protein
MAHVVSVICTQEMEVTDRVELSNEESKSSYAVNSSHSATKSTGSIEGDFDPMYLQHVKGQSMS